jgi:hypothetical protein
MVADARTVARADFNPKLGGGTRLMLALNHRISDDIDLFIRDPQWIGYLSPRLNERFENDITGYSENAVALKIRLLKGEIDFIVGMSLLGMPDESAPETKFALEPVAEVLAKILFHHGWALTPRDLFDWWAIETSLPGAVPVSQMANLLESKYPEIERSLGSLALSQAAKGIWGEIKAPGRPEIEQTVAWGQQRLSQYAAVLNAEHAERERRIEAIPALKGMAGPAYGFWVAAASAMDRLAEEGAKIPWGLVEAEVIDASLFMHGQSPESVFLALSQHSPGSVSSAQQRYLREHVFSRAEQLRNKPEYRQRDKPRNSP